MTEVTLHIFTEAPRRYSPLQEVAGWWMCWDRGRMIHQHWKNKLWMYMERKEELFDSYQGTKQYFELQ